MKQADPKDVAPALPDRCPHCGQQGYNGDSRIFWRGEVRSPVRGHTTGIAQSTQLYLSQLVRSMGDTPAQSRTILFTDSRDDAARTAAGVARNHFRDLIRQLIRQVMDERPPDPLAVLRKAATSPASLDDSEQYILNSYIAEHPEAWRLIQKEQFVPLTAEERAVLDALAQAAPGGTENPWGELQAQISTRLVNLGVPPGGPGPSMRMTPSGAPLVPGLPAAAARGMERRCPVPQMAGAQLAFISSLNVQLAEALFDRAGRDVESVGLGWIEPRDPDVTQAPTDPETALGDPAVLRPASRHRPPLLRSRVRQGVADDARRRQALPRASRRAPGHRPRSAHRVGHSRPRPRPGRRSVAAPGAVADRPAHPGRGHRPHVALPQVRLPAPAPLSRRVRQPGLPGASASVRSRAPTRQTTITPGCPASGRAGSPSPS